MRAAVGGNRSGKSYAGAADVVARALLLSERRSGVFWICGQDSAAWRDVQERRVFALLDPDQVLLHRRSEKYTVICARGRSHRMATLVFKTYESGAQAFMGADVDGIWLDEEPPREVFNECWARVLDRGGWLSLTFTPIESFRKGRTWLYEEVVAKPRIADTEVFRLSTYDNPHLPRGAADAFAAGLDEYERRVRLYGDFVWRSLNPVFDADELAGWRRRLAERPPEELRTDLPGSAVCWERPRVGGRYVIGADVAEGLEGGDWDAGVVVRVGEDGRTYEAAELHGHLAPFEFAAELADLSRAYNDALVAVEVNGPGLAVVEKLTELGVNQLVRSGAGGGGGPGGAGGPRFGVRTTSANKAWLVSLLAEAVRTGNWVWRSGAGVDEALAYVWDGRGGMGAQSGAHDDRVMARVMASLALRGAVGDGPSVPTTAQRTPGFSGGKLPPLKEEEGDTWNG